MRVLIPHTSGGEMIWPSIEELKRLAGVNEYKGYTEYSNRRKIR